MQLTIHPKQLTLSDIRGILTGQITTLYLPPATLTTIQTAKDIVTRCLHDKKPVYGINTGFGALANTCIAPERLTELQHHLVLSHAAGTGELLPEAIVRLIIVLKIYSLACGFSGIRPTTLNALIQLYNHAVWPCIPSQGSVGASGDLAPLAHLSAILLGEGSVQHNGQLLSAKEGLALAGLPVMTLDPKEGLALINGTQVSTALALYSYHATENLFLNALVTGALSVEAALGSHAPFDARIQAVRGHSSQIKVAALLRQLLANSPLQQSHQACDKVQDPYSLRCQPQVMGACLAQIQFVHATLLTEANAVSDNPLIFSEDQTILSGGNFHAEPVAMAADNLALAITEIGALAERRIALLTDPHFSGLPAFLTEDAGMYSGFMSAQVTAAALASENKHLAHPASIDSLPTSANQEDHVSMATHAARRLLLMTENLAGILAIELLASCQGLEFHYPLETSPLLKKVFAHIRQTIPFYKNDRYFAPDIAMAKKIIQSGALPMMTDLSLNHDTRET